jgi:hypothetical protein
MSGNMSTVDSSNAVSKVRKEFAVVEDFRRYWLRGNRLFDNLLMKKDQCFQDSVEGSKTHNS